MSETSARFCIAAVLTMASLLFLQFRVCVSVFKGWKVLCLAAIERRESSHLGLKLSEKLVPLVAHIKIKQFWLENTGFKKCCYIKT